MKELKEKYGIDLESLSSEFTNKDEKKENKDEPTLSTYEQAKNLFGGTPGLQEITENANKTIKGLELRSKNYYNIVLNDQGKIQEINIIRGGYQGLQKNHLFWFFKNFSYYWQSIYFPVRDGIRDGLGYNQWLHFSMAGSIYRLHCYLAAQYDRKVNDNVKLESEALRDVKRALKVEQNLVSEGVRPVGNEHRVR